MQTTEGQAPFPHALRCSQTPRRVLGKGQSNTTENLPGVVWPVGCARKDNSQPPSAPVPSAAPVPVGHTSGRTILLWQKDVFLPPLHLRVLLQPHAPTPPNIWGYCCIPCTRRKHNAPYSPTSEQVKASVSHNSCPACFSLPGSGHAHLCVCAYPATHDCTLLSACPLPFCSLEGPRVVLGQYLSCQSVCAVTQNPWWMVTEPKPSCL